MNLITRSEWGAWPARCSSPLNRDRLHGLAVHYSGMDADERADHANCASRVRGIQRFHMETRKWCDIAYSYVFCKHGFVFEGRGPRLRTAAQGTNFGNDRFLAACFLGDDTPVRDDVTPEGRLALAQLRVHLLDLHPYADQTFPHSHFTQTACPGDDLRNYIRSVSDWRAQLDTPSKEEPLPDWLIPWLEWRFIWQGQPERRPHDVPSDIPRWAWDVFAAVQRIVKVYGPSGPFLDFFRWHLIDGRSTPRPDFPIPVPPSAWSGGERLHRWANEYRDG